MSESINYKFNITVLGYNNVGKTSMISIINGEHFDDTGLITVAIDCSLIDIKIDNKNIKVKIFDTPGVERQRSACISTIYNANGIILLFAVDDLSSFEDINNWLNMINERINKKDVVIYLVGNKIDLEDRKISKEEGLKFAEEKGIKYFEISAKNELNIRETFNELCKDIYFQNKNSPKYFEYAYSKKNYIKKLMKYISK